MSIFFQAILLLVLLIVMMPVSVLLFQSICAWLPRKGASYSAATRPSLAILIPAHNESAGISRTLASVLPQLQVGDRVVVVADNCTDDTADVAASAGAEVIRRDDASRRGKGYALDFGVRHLERNPPEAVIIVDADCEVAAGTIDRIARTVTLTQRPVQALYLMKAPAGASPMAAIAEFAQVIKNQVRPLGYLRLGLPCQLMGTGMAFPWDLIRSMQLASGNLVEDMKMGIDCALAGRPALFCPEALVLSHFPANREGARTQRMRWEHGHLAMIFSEAPRLLLQALRGRGAGIFALAFDICVPPLALLGLSVLVMCGLGAGHYFVGGSALPLQLSLLAMAGLAVAVFLSWFRFGREIVSLRALACAPLYVAGKLPVYARFLFRRQVEWVRSRRDGG